MNSNRRYGPQCYNEALHGLYVSLALHLWHQAQCPAQSKCSINVCTMTMTYKLYIYIIYMHESHSLLQLC